MRQVWLSRVWIQHSDVPNLAHQCGRASGIVEGNFPYWPVASAPPPATSLKYILIHLPNVTWGTEWQRCPPFFHAAKNAGLLNHKVLRDHKAISMFCCKILWDDRFIGQFYMGPPKSFICVWTVIGMDRWLSRGYLVRVAACSCALARLQLFIATMHQ